MEYVYRYKLNNIPVYIGITNNLDARIKQHKNDDWYIKNRTNLSIDYITAESRADAECLEYYFIDKYDTSLYYNIAKTNKGSVSYFDNRKFSWTNYNYKEEVSTTKQEQNNNKHIVCKAEKSYLKIIKNTVMKEDVGFYQTLQLIINILKELSRNKSLKNYLILLDGESDISLMEILNIAEELISLDRDNYKKYEDNCDNQYRHCSSFRKFKNGSRLFVEYSKNGNLAEDCKKLYEFDGIQKIDTAYVLHGDINVKKLYSACCEHNNLDFPILLNQLCLYDNYHGYKIEHLYEVINDSNCESRFLFHRDNYYKPFFETSKIIYLSENIKCDNSYMSFIDDNRNLIKYTHYRV